MKLSEAINLGAMLRPQAHGAIYETRERPMHANGVLGLLVDERVASCAMGAAYEAAGCKMRMATPEEEQGAASRAYKPFRGEHIEGAPTQFVETPSEWLPVLNALMDCPACDFADSIYRLIPHLNDHHQWSREEIAALISRVESGIEATAVRDAVTIAPTNAR
jgi:hypothetical protein